MFASGRSCARLVLVSASFLLVVPAASDDAPPSDGDSPRTRLVSPRHGLTGDEVEPGHDVEGGPASEGEQLRLLTPITEAEANAVDPNFRHWVDLIRTGQADKRIMRLYWYYRSRLDPFDRPIPEGWRELGLARLRDEARTRRALAAFRRTRAERLRQQEVSGEARWGGGGKPPASLAIDAAERLRQGSRGDSGVDLPGGVSPTGVWMPIGPFTIAGRTTGLDRPEGDSQTLYAAVADGGVWRTRDGGQSWERLSDFESTLSGGSIVLDPTNPSTIYFGTGEGNGAIDNYPGVGVLKSTDAGLTWTASNPFSSVVRRLAIHGSEPHRIYAAGSQGCYVSTDAGATFDPIAAPGLPTGTGASDVLIRPDDADWVYCALWGGANGGVYRSRDHGASWTKLAGGFPAGTVANRIALAISRSSPSLMLASVEEDGGTIYRTDDGGDSWYKPSGGSLGHCGGQCWYDNVVGIDPANPSVMYAGGVSAYRSTDGGVNWSVMSSGVHVDHHFIFTPAADEVILANDGGIYRSINRGSTWTEWSTGMDTTQYYGICRHPSDEYWAFGGTQDNGSHRRRVADGWLEVLGGDGGQCMAGPPGSNVIVGEHQNHDMRRSADDGATWVWANDGILGGPRLWVGILTVDPSDRHNMWTATNRVYRSKDAKATAWVAVSTALYFSLSVEAIEVAPSDSNVVYVGFTAGGLYKSTNALADPPTWTSVRGSLPQRTVRRIRAHPDDASTVYVVFSGYGAGKIWKSTEGGGSWVDHTGDLPDVPVNDLLVDGDSPGTLLAATDLGVYRSDDDGATWYGFSSGLPTAAAIDFTYNRATGKLRVGTHGRSVWEWKASVDTPIALPDGVNVPGTPMTVAKLGAAEMRVFWDVASLCVAPDYDLLYGDLEDVATRSYSGATCDLGTSGRADVPLPVTSSGSAFFAIVATNGQGIEGPHGFDEGGQPIPATGVGFCDIASQDLAASCP